MKTIDAYMETVDGGMIKWGKKVELLKVLSGERRSGQRHRACQHCAEERSTAMD